MGIFQQWQPQFAEHGVATFPVEITASGKKPMVKGYQKIGRNYSHDLIATHGDANALGFVAGEKTGLSILDIDKPCEKLLADCLDRHGKSAVVVRTGSGKFHVYYSHNGEGRKIRPWRDASGVQLPIDIIGQGMAVAPPSKAVSGSYEIIHGNLNDIPNLKPMSRLTGQYALGNIDSNSGLIGEGNRDQALFRYSMRQAHHCDNIDVLLDIMRNYANSSLDRVSGHAFTDQEIIKKANHVWNLTQSGKNLFGKGHQFSFHGDELDRLQRLGPDTLSLYLYMRRKHQGHKDFIIANIMHKHMPSGHWSEARLKKARALLVNQGLIVSIRKPSSATGAENFAWPENAKFNGAI